MPRSPLSPSPNGSPRRSLASCDVAIVGGGLMGAATAWALARRAGSGRRVVLLEAKEPAHRGGSSHGDGRIVRFTYAEAVYLEMARQVYPLWAELERSSGTELLVTTGSWECGRHDSEILADLARGLDEAGIPFERLDAQQSQRRFPHLALPEHGICLYQKDGAVVRAAESVHALWRQAGAAGVETHTGRRVTRLEPGDGGVEVRMVDARGQEERLRAGAVVITGGGWAGQLLADIGLELPLQVCREVLAYFPRRTGTEIEEKRPVDVRA
ncbi:MAG: FAD-dependent oxidoreductase, partial [Holophagales bacterium]|nr:FAD-dependent oxidoreductase [Holophagales bacterium]